MLKLHESGDGELFLPVLFSGRVFSVQEDCASISFSFNPFEDLSVTKHMYGIGKCSHCRLCHNNWGGTETHQAVLPTCSHR